MALFRRNSTQVSAPPPAPPVVPVGSGPTKKDRPTPSRREAEAARKQRVTRTLTKKEARVEASQHARSQRLRTMAVREGVPEKALMRDYIDARFSVGELLLPSLVVILAFSFITSRMGQQVALLGAGLMYLYIFLVMVDGFFMWRGFKKVLAKRMPATSPRGLLMYGMNRCIQIRRFRMPPPRIKRGEAY